MEQGHRIKTGEYWQYFEQSLTIKLMMITIDNKIEQSLTIIPTILLLTNMTILLTMNQIIIDYRHPIIDKHDDSY